MTSTPDQSPAATEVAKVPATDPVEQASVVAAEQDPAPDDAVGSNGSAARGTAARVEQAEDDQPDADQPEADTDAVSGADTGEAPAEDAEPDASADGGATDAGRADRAEGASAEPAAGDATVRDSSGRSASSEPAPEPDGEADDVVSAAAAAPAGEASSASDSAPEAEAKRAEPATPRTADTTPERPSAPQRAEASTEEISIVPAPAPPQPVKAKPPVGAKLPTQGAAADTIAAEKFEPESDSATGTKDAADTDPDTSRAAEAGEPRQGTPSDTAAPTSGPGTPPDAATPPAVDETLDFKALSFAAIAAAHKRALGPRTVAGETEPAEAAADGMPEDSAADGTAADGAVTAPGEAQQAVEREQAVEAQATPAELFAPPAARTQPPAVPPSPFPAPTAPPRQQPAAPQQALEPAPQHPSPPFPGPRGGSAHAFPAVHGYAPEAAYAGWRPPTEADKVAKRRRFTLIGGAVAAVIAVVVVVVVIANMVSRQQWEPIEAMIAEPREVQALQLVLGSCVETMPEDGEVSEVLAVPCDAAHTAQVVGRTDFADAAVWPGRDEVDKRVAQVCGTKQLGPTARTSKIVNSVSYVVWGPSEESWADGDRVGLCLATTAEPITRDLLQ